jgi:hypothetical protein
MPTPNELKWPFQIEPGTLRRILEETQGREILPRQVIREMERKYDSSLEELERRLSQGKGNEHPDWEDAIEWRNAVDALQRIRTLEAILQWLIDSREPSPVS